MKKKKQKTKMIEKSIKLLGEIEKRYIKKTSLDKDIKEGFEKARIIAEKRIKK